MMLFFRIKRSQPAAAPTSTIIAIDVHHHGNEVLIKNLRRNICSIPTNNTPEHTIMKRQTLLGIAFSVFAINAFAVTPAHTMIAEGGSDKLIESRVAEGGSDRLIERRVAEGGSDRLIERRVAEGGSDRLIERRVAEGGSDRLIERRVAEGGSDRLIERRVAEGGSDRLIERRVA
nr:phage infection protein [Pseudomonas sp. MG-9]